MSGCELAEIEQAAGQKCQPIGHIGYYYPAEVWISEYGKLYAKYEYQDEIECFPDVFALIERELRQYKFDSAAMKQWRHWTENYETGLYYLAQSNIAESVGHFTAEIRNIAE